MRTGILLLLGLLALGAAWAQEEAKYVVVELNDGTRVVGKVVEEECTDDALVVRQVRGDTKTTIPWDQIKPQQAHELRVEYGFEVREAAEGALTMKGHEIRNQAGVTFRGLWTNEKTARADGIYVLKTSDGERRIPAGDVKAGPEPCELSELDVYTPKELYQRKVAEVTAQRSSGENQFTAEDHYKLAEYALLIDALEEAKLHYEKAIELNDPKYTREKLERRITQVQRLLQQSEAREALKQIKRALFDRRFDKAATLIAAFKEKYAADPALAKAAADLEEKSKDERDEYYVGIVPARLRDAVKDILERKVKEKDPAAKESKDLSLAAAQEYASGQASAEKSASHDAVEQVAKDLGLAPVDVLRYWDGRKRINVYKAFYRDGTFAVLDNVEDALAKAPKPPKPQAGQTAPKVPPPTKPMTAEDWWKGKMSAKKYGDLRDWLFAYWAEKAEMCELIAPKDDPCPTCFGKGYTQGSYTTPQGTVPYYNRCQTCYMAKFQRVVRFK